MNRTAHASRYAKPTRRRPCEQNRHRPNRDPCTSRSHIGDQSGLSPPITIMATIKARRQANGAIRYTAIVRKRVDKKLAHREVALEDPSALIRVQQCAPPLAELIRPYDPNSAGTAADVQSLVGPRNHPALILPAVFPPLDPRITHLFAVHVMGAGVGRIAGYRSRG